MTQEELNRIIDSDSYFAARKDPSEAEIPASFFCAPIRIVISCSGRFAKYAPSQPSQPYSPFTQIPCCNSGATHLRIKFA